MGKTAWHGQRTRLPAPIILLTLALVLGGGGCDERAAARIDAALDSGLIWPDGPADLPDHGPSRSEAGPVPAIEAGTPSTVEPPLGGSSQGSGGAAAPGGVAATAGGISFVLIVPSSYQVAIPNPLMIIYSGTEGATMMANNMLQTAAYSGLGGVIIAVLDGPTYFGNAQAGATVLDHLRASYNIDNDRTYLLSESAGTSAGLQLGLGLRQSYFAAYWANDVNASAAPQKTAAQLGFAPWGNAGPGGQLAAAAAIVNGMKAAGYRLPADAPYSGPGADTHGSTEQFLAALAFFPGKSRQ